MPDFELKRHDTLPSLEAELVTVQDGSEAAYLLDDVSTVLFSMKSRDSDGTTMVDSQTAVVSDATAGRVRYDWQTGDTERVGLYDAEFRITKNDGSIISPPIISRLIVEVKERVN